MNKDALVVDTHVHILSQEGVRYPQDHLFQIDWIRTHPLDVDELRSLLTVASVDKATLVQAPSAHRYDNSYVVDSALQFPELFVSVGIIDPLVEDAVNTLQKWHERGMSSLRMYASQGGRDFYELDDQRVLPVWECVRDLNMVVTVQCQPAQIPGIRNILQRYPTITIVLEKLGGLSVTDDALKASRAQVVSLATLPNAYLKFDAGIIDSCQNIDVPLADLLGPILDSFGTQRVMWGSNYPARHDRPYSELVQASHRALTDVAGDGVVDLMGMSAARLWPALID